jgi:methionyl-tRNA formyltransferase
MRHYKYALCSQGSQGVMALIELFKRRVDLNSIHVLTFESNFNRVFIDYLHFNKMEYCVIKDKKDLVDVFDQNVYDILISAGFRYIFTKPMLAKIQIAAVNFHPGLLPNYRGSFSTAWSIINGEKYVGYTYHYIATKVDSGNIIVQRKFLIGEEDTSHSLHYRIWQNGLSELGMVIDKCLAGFEGEVQAFDGIFYPNKLPYEGLIDPEWDETLIHRFIRSMYFPPFKPARLQNGNAEYYFSNVHEYKNYFKTQRGVNESND